jgi:hypothetical protein
MKLRRIILKVSVGLFWWGYIFFGITTGDLTGFVSVKGSCYLYLLRKTPVEKRQVRGCYSDLCSWLGTLCFAWIGVMRNKLHFSLRGGIRGWTGGLLIIFSLIIYPLLGLLFGHRYPTMPTFGLPCPTTIFTIGVLLFAEGHYQGLFS